MNDSSEVTPVPVSPLITVGISNAEEFNERVTGLTVIKRNFNYPYHQQIIIDVDQNSDTVQNHGVFGLDQIFGILGMDEAKLDTIYAKQSETMYRVLCKAQARKRSISPSTIDDEQQNLSNFNTKSITFNGAWLPGGEQRLTNLLGKPTTFGLKINGMDDQLDPETIKHYVPVDPETI